MSAGPRVVPTLSELLADPDRAAGVSPEVARHLLIEFAPLRQALELAATATPRATSAAAPEAARPGKESHWLTPDEAAAVANLPRRTIYGWSRRSDWRPFAKRLSRKVLRIEEVGFRRWLDHPKMRP
jgi:hypothetical protein